METVELRYPFNPDQVVDQDILLVLGFFDGVHLAHQSMIKKGVELAKEKALKTAVMTFDKHPGLVFKPYHPRDIQYLTSLEQKQALMESLGVDILYVLNFTGKFASLAPQEFVDTYILGLHARAVVCGFDYSFGYAGQGSAQDLEKYSQGRFEVYVMDQMIDEDGDKISSSKVRHLIKEGQVGQAGRLLNRPYENWGMVVHGKARGRKLGFPTANIFPDPYSLLPGIGVYATRTWVEGQWYGSMTSVGYNVTFGDSNYYTVESNLFDFDENIYGERVCVQWLEYLRPEIKFDSVQGLIDQLEADEEASRQILKDW